MGGTNMTKVTLEYKAGKTGHEVYTVTLNNINEMLHAVREDKRLLREAEINLLDALAVVRNLLAKEALQ